MKASLAEPRQAATQRVPIERHAGGRSSRTDDAVAREEPLEILVRVGARGRPRTLALTMRTPGRDVDLAYGLLFAERVIDSAADVLAVRFEPRRGEAQEFNALEVTLRPGVRVDWPHLERPLLMSAACGVCGRASIDHLRAGAKKAPSGGGRFSRRLLGALPDSLRSAQSIFDSTGGLHAAGLFDTKGHLVGVCEDVGRHNAVDKLVGSLVRVKKLPGVGSVLLVSGRAGFEILQKAVRAGFPIVASVGAPSSLAVDVAKEFGTCLVGFLREGRFNVYAGASRLAP